MTIRQQVEQRTTDLIRALGGADAICKPGCACRGTYTGPERRSVARHIEQGQASRIGSSPVGAATGASPAPECPAEGCDLFGPHELHRDSEGFEWRQVTA
jgi:hypothetical protein